MSHIVICGNAVNVFGPFDSHDKANAWLALHAHGWDREGTCMNSHEITWLRTPPTLTPRPQPEDEE